jgi:hypothetical protein
MSQFSTFGPKSLANESTKGDGVGRNFSSFGKPALHASSASESEVFQPNSILADKKPDTDNRRHKPRITRGNMLTWFSIGLLTALVCTVFFYPYEQFKPAIESSATRLLKTQ